MKCDLRRQSVIIAGLANKALELTPVNVAVFCAVLAFLPRGGRSAGGRGAAQLERSPAFAAPHSIRCDRRLPAWAPALTAAETRGSAVGAHARPVDPCWFRAHFAYPSRRARAEGCHVHPSTFPPRTIPHQPCPYQSVVACGRTRRWS